jgi:outer membrane lipoprotein-sorting protein
MRHQTLAWVAPAGVVAVVIGGAAVATASSARPDLEPRTAGQILVSVAESDVEALSGEIRTSAELGLPELPDGLGLTAGAVPTGEESAGTAPSDGSGEPTDQPAQPGDVVTRLLSGENSIRFWTDGDRRLRVDLDDPLAAVRLVVDEEAVSFWSRQEGTVTRYVLPDGARPPGEADPGDDPYAAPIPGPDRLTPQAVAERFLAEAGESTEIVVDEPTVVAGRDAYVLRAEPRAAESLVDRVVLAVDAETGLPLRFQIFAVGQRQAAFETGFLEVEFGVPAAETFTEAFPDEAAVVPGGSVDDLSAPWDGLQQMGPESEAWTGLAAADEPEVRGDGWAAVLVFDGPAEGSPDPTDLTDPTAGEDPAAALGGVFEEVDGGRALRTALVSVLLTDDGRILVGAVTVDALEAAARG